MIAGLQVMIPGLRDHDTSELWTPDMQAFPALNSRWLAYVWMQASVIGHASGISKEAGRT